MDVAALSCPAPVLPPGGYSLEEAVNSVDFTLGSPAVYVVYEEPTLEAVLPAGGPMVRRWRTLCMSWYIWWTQPPPPPPPPTTTIHHPPSTMHHPPPPQPPPTIHHRHHRHHHHYDHHQDHHPRQVAKTQLTVVGRGFFNSSALAPWFRCQFGGELGAAPAVFVDNRTMTCAAPVKAAGGTALQAPLARSPAHSPLGCSSLTREAPSKAAPAIAASRFEGAGQGYCPGADGSARPPSRAHAYTRSNSATRTRA